MVVGLKILPIHLCWKRKASFMGSSVSRAIRVRLFVLALGVGVLALVSGCAGGGSGSGSTGSGGGSGSGGGGSTTPTPAITSISPTSVTAGSSAMTLTVNGSGFVSTSVVQVGGTAEATQYVSASQLTATVPASQIANGGNLAVTVVNGTVSSGTGSAQSLVVNNPSPTITSLNPTSEVMGTASATVVVTGTGFVPATVIDVNGSARTTTFTSATQVSVTLTAADLDGSGSLALTAVNPTPGGGTSAAASVAIILPPGTPQIESVSPTNIYAGSGATTLMVYGLNFTASSVVQWNGTALATSGPQPCNYYYCMTESILTATVPAADVAAAGTSSVTVETAGVATPVSNAVTVTITNAPAPTVTSIYPNSGPINAATPVAVQGTGFAPDTVVEVNGEPVPTTYSGATSLTATIPGSSVAFPGNVNVTVMTPAPGGGTATAQVYTAYVAITTSDIVYNSKDGLIYASVPGDSPDVTGNSVVGIDPTTGNVMRQIWVGSNPNKLALSSDGTQLFVGLDGAASVAQVDLTQGKVVNQFSLGGGSGLYNPPMTALYMAAVPGSPDSVAVSTMGGTGNTSAQVTIYDSGVARANAYTSGEGPLSFGASASTLYVVTNLNVEELTVDATGITGATALTSSTQGANWVQYDNGTLYLSGSNSGAEVLNASTGALDGTLYSSGNTPAIGPIVSDSAVGRAFIGENNFEDSTVLAFDESTFDQVGSFPVNQAEDGYGSSQFVKIARWGQNGLALIASPSAFSLQTPLYIFQSSLVKDLSSSPADLSVTLTAPGTATTGGAVSYVTTVTNNGPNAASGAAVSVALDPSLIINGITASQGSCGTGTTFSCDLGTLANGASATVTVSATATTAGTLAGSAIVNSTSYDPTESNNEATTSTTVTGDIYGAVPTLSGISPNLVQAGATDFTLTVNGAGFNENSTVNLGGSALSTTYVSATQLTADVPAADVATYGWAPVTVTNPAPGGGTTAVQPLTIYDLVNVPANGLLFDPYSQLLYATVPSTSTTVTGDSVVSINPVTGAVGTPVNVGSQPTVLAETTDGNYLWVGLSGADSLAQFNLQNQSVSATIPLSLSGSAVSATWLAAMPGNDNSLAIGVTNGWGQFGIFDVSGSTGSFRTDLAGIYEGDDPVFADASHIYAYDTQTSGAEFYRYSVDATGLTEIDGTTLDGMGGFSGGFQLVNGLVYGYSGGIINPSTTPPSQVATLPLVDFYGSGSTAEGAGAVADPSLQKDFLILWNPAGTSAYGLVRYDLNTYLPQAVLNLPSVVSTFNSSLSALRFGQDGLAMITSSSVGTNNQTPSILLLRGPFVAPQELGTGTAASLTSSSASTITHGSGNTVLTLTGSNFEPGTAVTWNGSYRTTTIVSPTQVTVDIPASDVASTGTATVVATNPGAAASNALTITVD